MEEIVELTNVKEKDEVGVLNSPSPIDRNAKIYVEHVCSNKKLVALYKKNGNLSDHQLQGLAYKDFVTPPKILGIYSEKFLNHRAKPIMIRTKDIVGVKQVLVRICNAKGELLEKGNAVQYLQKEKWFYFVKRDIKEQKEVRIEVKAIDNPGNFAALNQWLTI